MNGKVVLITGGSRGLGQAVATHFAQEGAEVAIAARDWSRLQVARDEIVAAAVQAHGARGRGSVLCYRVNVSDPDDVASLVADITETFGRVDVLVCCAGIYGPIGALEDTDWQEWREAIEVNLLGTVLCCRAVVPVMRSHGSGKIITISGGGATKPTPMFSAYAASKAAVVRFTETLARELCGWGIDCNSVAPGMLDTRLRTQVIRAGVEYAGTPAYTAALADLDVNAMERAVELIVWLASSKSNGITGRLISAVWDNWRHLSPGNLSPDAYTLRRWTPLT